MAAVNSGYFYPYEAPSRWSGVADYLYEAIVTAIEKYAFPLLPAGCVRRGWQNGVSLPAGTKDYCLVTVLGRERRGTNVRQYECGDDRPRPDWGYTGTLTEQTLRIATVQASFFSATDDGARRADSLVTFARGFIGGSYFRQWHLGMLDADAVQCPDFQDGTKTQVHHNAVTMRVSYWSGLKADLPFFDSLDRPLLVDAASVEPSHS